MKKVWIRLKSWSKEMVTTALEAGADALIIPEEHRERVKVLGRVRLVCRGGDLEPGEDVRFETLHDAEDEERIAKLLRSIPVVLEGVDWDVIPLENLVARGGELYVAVDSLERAELACGVLEKGVAGVVFDAQDATSIRALISRVKAINPRFPLVTAVVQGVEPAGLGDRVCVDTCSLMSDGEGLLVGNASGFTFLVHAETRNTPYVAPRPFRVNAGPVHAYVHVPDGKTRYLCELRSGDRVLVVNPEGESREAVVGRVKIERRPLVLVSALCADHHGSVLLQNAETIALTRPGGEAVSVTHLQTGDEILALVDPKARHFGMVVEESLVER